MPINLVLILSMFGMKKWDEHAPTHPLVIPLQHQSWTLKEVGVVYAAGSLRALVLTLVTRKMFFTHLVIFAVIVNGMRMQ